MATGQKSKKQIGIYISALTRLTRKPMYKLDYTAYQKCLLFNTLSFFIEIRINIDTCVFVNHWLQNS